MANINKGILSLIGNTPLVEVVNIEKNHEKSDEKRGLKEGFKRTKSLF